MARVREEFPLQCPGCGGDIRLIAFITEPGPIRNILTHLGEPLERPPVSPARGPPTDWGELVQAHDERDAIQSAPDDVPVIDIHSLFNGAGREEKRQRSGCGAFRETRSGRPGRSSRGSTVVHQPEDRCGSAIDRAIFEPKQVPTDSARRVAIGIYLERITDLSIRDSRFTVVCDLWFSWIGEHFDPAEHLVVVDGAIDTIELLDESRDGDRHHRRYQLTSTITKPFRIDHFPLDRHLLLIAFESGAMLRSELLFVPDLDNTAVSSRAAVHGYRLEYLAAIEKPHSYKTSRGEPGVLPGAKTTFSQARFGVAVARDGWGLFLKMFQALFVAVAIATLPCFIRPTDVDRRFGLGVGALFAAVANAYLVGSYGPDTGEFALADVVNLLGTVTILLTLVESTLSLHLFEHRGNRELSHRLDRISFAVTLGGFAAAVGLVLLAASAA